MAHDGKRPDIERLIRLVDEALQRRANGRIIAGDQDFGLGKPLDAQAEDAHRVDGGDGLLLRKNPD